MKVELCHFSQQKIYPSRGKKYIRIDGKVFNFANGKSEKSFFMKRNPREIRWTILYRRKHKKGSIEEQNKKRTRKNQKFNRAYAGATLEQIMQKRNQTTEVRKAQREQAIRAAKEKAAAKKKTKIQAAAKLAQKAQQSKVKVPKVVSKGPTRGGTRR